MDDEQATHRLGLLITSLGVLVLSPDTLLLRMIGQHGGDSSWTINFWRGLFLFIGMMTVFAAMQGRGAVKAAFAIGPWGLLAALVFGAQALTFVFSVGNTLVANTLVIIATAPFFSALFAWIFLGERAPPRTWIAILCACGGIAVIFSGSLGSGQLAGDLAALATAVGLGAGFVIVRHKRKVSMTPSMALGGLLAALVSLPLAEPFSLSPTGFGLMAFLGLVMLPVAFTMITLGPRYLPAPEVSLLLLLETVLGPFLVWLFLHETPDGLALTGGGIVIVTLVLHSLAGWRAMARRGGVET
ncbi:MAG: DMT family transporter [Rhodovibrionaceae bacterium]